MGSIIALYGRSGCGKTESIKNVFDLLKSKYPSANVKVIFTGKDIKAIITGINGLTIGIESEGDPGFRLEQSLKDFVKAKCDIIFCASRTRGTTVDWINSHLGKYAVDWTKQKYLSSKQAQINNYQGIAQDLIAKAGL
ncbi:MAG: hypothetical protein LBH44_01605 [Treponema sp.]|jgi:ABC-type dipeptide/oligopeptide/nickel transport system ATPase component|nr:hypothetical protein [Treponema sp.]